MSSSCTLATPTKGRFALRDHSQHLTPTYRYFTQRLRAHGASTPFGRGEIAPRRARGATARGLGPSSRSRAPHRPKRRERALPQAGHPIRAPRQRRTSSAPATQRAGSGPCSGGGGGTGARRRRLTCAPCARGGRCTRWDWPSCGGRAATPAACARPSPRARTSSRARGRAGAACCA